MSSDTDRLVRYLVLPPAQMRRLVRSALILAACVVLALTLAGCTSARRATSDNVRRPETRAARPGEFAPWAMYGADAQHTFRSRYAGPTKRPRMKWEYDVKRTVGSLTPPAVGTDGTVYFAASSGLVGPILGGDPRDSLYALNPDGSRKWQFDTGGQICQSPALGPDGTVHVVSNVISSKNRQTGATATLHALKPDGTKKWEVPARLLSWVAPVVAADGTVYFSEAGGSVSSHGRIYAIRADGKEKWVFEEPGMASAPAISTNGTAYFSMLHGTAVAPTSTFYAVTDKGAKQWSCPLPARFDLRPPALSSDEMAYFGTEDARDLPAPGRFDALSRSGSKVWAIKDVRPMSPAIASDGTVYVVSNMAKHPASLEARTPGGERIWGITGKGKLSAAAIDSNGTIYVVDIMTDDRADPPGEPAEASLIALNPDGSKKWTRTTRSSWTPELSPVIGSDGTIYIATGRNTLGAFSDR